MNSGTKNRACSALALLAVVTCAGLTSCKKGTYLELDFKGSTSGTINHIHLFLTVETPDGGLASDDTIPNPKESLTPTTVVTLPASAALDLDKLGDGSTLTISAIAYADVGETTALAQATASTTIMHGQTWSVTLNFGGGTGMDAGATPDLGTGQDGSLVTITDGSVDAGGCVAATVEASESVSLDYNSSGQDMDSGDKLWAYLGPAETYVGWMKFGLRFVPKAAHVTAATLNLFMVQAPTGGVPMLAVDYSMYDGWTRKSKASDVTIDGTISIGGPYVTPAAPPASTPYTLDVTNHNWMADIVDGTITLGIANTAVASAAVTSKVEFYGVNHTASPDPTRPTLDLVFCQ